MPLGSDAPTRVSIVGNRLRPALIGAITVALLTAWAAVLVRIAHEWPPNSDNVSVALTGHALLQGNWNLHGWWLGPAPFWTTESPVFALAVLVGGVSVTVSQVVAGLTWWGIAVIAIALAGSGLQGWARYVAMLVTLGFVGVVGPGLLESAIHNMTALFALAAIVFATLALRSSRLRPVWVGASALLLTAGVEGDPLTVAVAVMPIAAVSAAAAIRARRLRPWAWPLAAAVVALPAARVLQYVAAHTGGFAVTRGVGGFRANSAVIHETVAVISSFLRLQPGSSGASYLYFSAAVFIIVCALYGLLAWVRTRSVGDADAVSGWLTAVLLAGAASNIGAFLLLAPQPMTAGRRLVPACVYLAIAASRLAVVGLSRRGGPRAVGLGVAAVVHVVSAGSLAAELLLQPPAAVPSTALAAWLDAQGLREGYAGYWDANAVTVASGERVHVYAVRKTSDDRLTAFEYNASAAWYDAHRTNPVFVVIGDRSGDWIDRESAERTFGPPSDQQVVSEYLVLIWNHSLAPALAP